MTLPARSPLPSSLTPLNLPRGGLFEHIPAPVTQRLLVTGQRRAYARGALLNEVGDPCEGLSFILSGQVRVDQMAALGWARIAELGPGDVFGAMEWLEGKLWEERVVALGDAEVLFVPTRALKPLSASHPELQRQVERYTQRHTLHALLGESDLFLRLAPQDMLHLIDVATMRYVRAGTKIFDDKSRISSLIVIGKGDVRLQAGLRALQTLGVGDLLNVELALGDGAPALSALAESDATLYLISFDEVEAAFARAGALPALQALARHRRERAAAGR